MNFIHFADNIRTDIVIEFTNKIHALNVRDKIPRI